jgi:hypothetical protein
MLDLGQQVLPDELRPALDGEPDRLDAAIALAQARGYS